MGTFPTTGQTHPRRGSAGSAGGVSAYGNAATRRELDGRATDVVRHQRRRRERREQGRSTSTSSAAGCGSNARGVVADEQNAILAGELRPGRLRPLTITVS